VKFPKRIRYRGKALATIYGRGKDYPFYRVSAYVAGKRRMSHHRTYSEAKAAAESLAREIAGGSQAAALSPVQARDALAALERLQSFYQATGRRVSLAGCAVEYCEAAAKLPGRTLGEAVDGYLRTVASVKRKDIAEAVEELIAADAPRTQATNGQRAQLSAKYAYNRNLQLRRFAAAFPNTAVCDLSKEHLDAFLASLGEFSAKSRNHYRATVGQFLEWAVRKDYLTPAHRLSEAEAMRPERANTCEITFYTPSELAALLKVAEGPMRPLLALGGLAGLRTAELLRLDWADVWRVPGHVEITAGKSKTRARRLVEIGPALGAWLEPFRALKAGKLWTEHEITFQRKFLELCEAAEVDRKPNGLRHAFVTYHFAARANENLTAAQAGHSPAMIHAHYKGLATPAEAEKWFGLRPEAPPNVTAFPASCRT
jgi:integrase